MSNQELLPDHWSLGFLLLELARWVGAGLDRVPGLGRDLGAVTPRPHAVLQVSKCGGVGTSKEANTEGHRHQQA